MPVFTPTEAGKAFPATDVRHWLLDDERAVYTAAHCPDIQSSIDVEVRLSEYRGKRAPKKLTPEQEARESRASTMLRDYALACDPGVMRGVLKRLAQARMAAAPEAASEPE